ncbi:MAG: peptidylprolyl isomerase [Chloroflexi bacterium]|nr:peptidylprolyl isomerase [Chloroflexota bacterium]
MARNPQKQPLVTKKHLARQQREAMQVRYIFIVAAVVIVAVIGLVAYGVLSESVFKALQPVAVVNGDKITTREFQALARYTRQRMVDNAIQGVQLAQQLGNPDFQYSVVSQLYQIEAQLAVEAVGQETIDQLVEDRLVRQEAERRGITVSDADVEEVFRNGLGYFPNGTPTPEATLEIKPTSTLSPLQMTLVPPTPTATATEIPDPTATPTMTATAAPTATETPIPSVTPTLAPSATPTAFTEDAYNKQYQTLIDNYSQSIAFSEKDLRTVIEGQLLREKVMDAVLAETDLQAEEEQVWARHILVGSVVTATHVLSLLEQGGDWAALAAQYSTDASNSQNSGDLGWFNRTQMVQAFADAAFALEVGKISEPVQSSFGWHIIQTLGHEMRPLTLEKYDELRQQKFDEWLQAQREAAEVEIRDIWKERAPSDPVLPAEVLTFMNQVQAQQQQQQQLIQPTFTP